MAVYEDSEFFATRQPSFISVIAYRFVDIIDNNASALRHYIVRTQTERALQSLSNRQLSDIGVERAQISAFSEASARRWS